MRHGLLVSFCLLPAAFAIAGAAQAEIFYVPAGESRNIGYDHTYDAVLVEGTLNVMEDTTIVTGSFVVAPGGRIIGRRIDGADGADPVWLGIGQGFFGYSHNSPGETGTRGRYLTVWSSGLLEISGILAMPGGYGGDGGDGVESQPAKWGGSGASGGDVTLTGRHVFLGENFTIAAVGGRGGDGGDAAGVTYRDGGNGGSGGWGGDLIINHVDSFLYAGVGDYVSRVNVSGGAGGTGGSKSILGNNGANGNSGSPGSVTLNQWVLGDFNGDGLLNTEDINPFVLALTSPQLFHSTFPAVDLLAVDPNLDRQINTEDINHFIAHLTGSGGGGIIPEPASLALLGMGASSLLLRRR